MNNERVRTRDGRSSSRPNSQVFHNNTVVAGSERKISTKSLPRNGVANSKLVVPMETKLSIPPEDTRSGGRLIEEHGRVMVTGHGGFRRKRKFMEDIFTTAVELRWRFIVSAFISAFLVSWLLFAVVWQFLLWVHGDFEEDHLPDNQEESGWIPCVYSIYDFRSTFLFSVETQHTIGYGLRGTSHKCLDAILLQCIQSVIGVAIQACMAGVVFAKLSRPKKRARTVLLSRMAVISKVNGRLRLLFRAVNLRNSKLLEAHFRAEFFQDMTTEEGIVYRCYPRDMSLSTQLDDDPDDEPTDYASLFVPTVVSHIISEDSPLYNFDPVQLAAQKFEIVVTLEGIVEPSGNTTQVRKSYLPHQILWGHSFANCVNWLHKDDMYHVDYNTLDSVVPDDTPRMSARTIDEINQK